MKPLTTEHAEKHALERSVWIAGSTLILMDEMSNGLALNLHQKNPGSENAGCKR
jgi:hypothetical protein